MVFTNAWIPGCLHQRTRAGVSPPVWLETGRFRKNCQAAARRVPLVAAKFINNVRVRCKEGSEQAFLAATEVWVNPDGMTDAYWAKTGERQYCFVGLWESEAALIAARPQMIEHLNAVRDCLEELSPELGVTDPVSGHVVTHKC